MAAAIEPYVDEISAVFRVHVMNGGLGGRYLFAQAAGALEDRIADLLDVLDAALVDASDLLELLDVLLAARTNKSGQSARRQLSGVTSRRSGHMATWHR